MQRVGNELSLPPSFIGELAFHAHVLYLARWAGYVFACLSRVDLSVLGLHSVFVLGCLVHALCRSRVFGVACLAHVLHIMSLYCTRLARVLRASCARLARVLRIMACLTNVSRTSCARLARVLLIRCRFGQALGSCRRGPGVLV